MVVFTRTVTTAGNRASDVLVDMVSPPEGAQTEWNIAVTFPQYKDSQLD